MKPLDLLKEEHRAIERALNVLETAVGRLEKGERLSSRVFRDALHFIKTFADRCHHGKEEDLLFPAMERKGFPRQGGPLAVMLYEHEEGRKHVRAMAEAVEGYETGDEKITEDLISHARAFVALLREHISKEDNVLFVMADQHLSEPEQARLMEEFTEVETKGEACKLKSELLLLLEKLERGESA